MPPRREGGGPGLRVPSRKAGRHPPVAEKQPRIAHVHGVELRDDYAWLRADNWQEVLRDPARLPAAIKAHLDAENAYCARLMADTRALQRRLIKEMRGRIREDDSSVPQPDGPFAYYRRFRRGGEHALVCRRPLAGGREQILLDVPALAAGKEFFDLGTAVHSPDHRLLGWSCDEAGSERYTIRLRDTGTGTDLPDIVTQTTGDLVWAADSRAFFYVRLDDNHRPKEVFRRMIGGEQASDACLYREADDGMFLDIGKTQSGRFLVVSIGDHETSEVRTLDLTDPGARLETVLPRRTGLQYSIEHHDERFLILTNADGAEDFKVVAAPTGPSTPDIWRDLVPHRQGRIILSQVCLSGRHIRLEREDSLPRIVIRELASGDEHSIAFADEAYGLGMDAGFAFDTDRLRFSTSSMSRPGEVYDYDMATRVRTLVKRQEVPSGHDPAAYVVRRLMATADDGAQVPVSLVHRVGLALDGSAPCLLYGYGSYGIALSASFRTNILSLVDRGFVYAIAHIRGGTDKGWRWYLDGKRQNKPNTFTDFIACAEMLAVEGYTAHGRIVAQGGSAGGMLMGAVANLRPDLFAGIIAEVPFVDVLNTILDASLPLTPPEWPEWGNPITDKAAFDVIAGYSPYDNVSAQAYPPILAVGGLTDPRVTYWEPAKWVQHLRATMTGGGPVLLKTNMEAGHGGAAGRFDHLKDVALAYAFALKAANGFSVPAEPAD
jgi:oligopeptidase B